MSRPDTLLAFIGLNDQELLHRMCDTMVHRGPDDSGVYYQPGVGLGHRRLSIIDLSAGHQPMHNEDKAVWIVFNGEIYNFQELQPELNRLGHKFHTRSDTETIIHAYEEWGKECVNRLQGMFAFAIWDSRNQTLFLARDRLGIKPLYYAVNGDSLLFASEAKVLLQYPGLPARINESAIDTYFTFRYVPGAETIFEGIKRLPPASILTQRQGKITIEKYWEPDFTPDERPLSYYKEAFRERLKETIRQHLISEVPLGAYLSGGLDSSFLVGLMSQVQPNSVETFSVGFKDERYNEAGYARLVADEFGTHHHELTVDDPGQDLLTKVIWHMDEPVADAAVIPTYLMAQLTKEYVTVVLSGEGADELLAGYPKYKALGLMGKLQGLLPRSGWECLSGIFGRRIDLHRAMSAMGERDKAAAYLKLTSVFSEEEKQWLYTPRLKQIISRNKPPQEIVRPYFELPVDGLSQLLQLDINTWLPDDLLIKNDKMTMAHAIEARVPYLDHKLVEFMARIPARYKLHLLTDKYILRQAMQGVVPEAIRRRKKTGFTAPLGLWFGQDLKAIVDQTLRREVIETQGYLNWDYVQHILKQNLDNAYYRRQFWSILVFSLWSKVFIDA